MYLFHNDSDELSYLLLLLWRVFECTNQQVDKQLVNLSTRKFVTQKNFVHLLLYLWYKQLVNLSTRWLVYLPCYFVFDTSNLLTCPLADLSTYHVTLSFYYPVFLSKQLVYSFTRQLVNLSTYHVTLSLIQATRSLVNSFTCQLNALISGVNTLSCNAFLSIAGRISSPMILNDGVRQRI